MNPNSLVLIQKQEIVALQQLVRELGVTHSLLRFQPLFHADLLRHHSPNPSVLPHIFQKIQQLDLLPPIVVVEDDGVLGEDSGDGGLNAEGVAAERVEVEVEVEVEVGTLKGLAGGVADVSGGSVDEGDGLVAEAVEPGEDDEAEEVAEVERLSGGVETAVNFES